MSKSKRKIRSLVAVAASMRATGMSWDKIAAAVNRSAERVRKWPHWYPEEWEREFHRAELQYLDQTAGEAQFVLRQLLREASDQVRLGACALVLKPRMAESARRLAERPLDPRDRDSIEAIQSPKPHRLVLRALSGHIPAPAPAGLRELPAHSDATELEIDLRGREKELVGSQESAEESERLQSAIDDFDPMSPNESASDGD